MEGLLCDFLKWGIGLAGLKKVLINLLTKWVMYALQHGFFNVLILLRYHLGSTRPNKNKKWGQNINSAVLS